MTSKSDLIEFACPHCSAKFKTAIVNGGKRIRCRKCEQPLTVPEAGLVEPELDAVFDDVPQPDAGPVEPLKEPGDPLEFDFDSVDIDDILANAKLAEAEAARLAEETKSRQSQTEKLPEVQIQKTTTTTSSPQSSDSAFESGPATAAHDQETDQVDLATRRPGKLPKVERDERLTHADGFAPADVDEAADREVDLGPLQVEGITSDKVDVDELYGVKCPVCDTRIHVTPDKVNTQIECPICYSPVEVFAPSERPRYRPDWIQPESNSTRDNNEADELKLSDPIERPKVEHFIEPGFGLPDVDKDLLAPVASAADQSEQPDQIPELQVVETPARAATEEAGTRPNQRQTSSDSSSPQSGAERRRTRGEDRTSRRERLEQSQVDEEERPLSVHASDDLKPLTIKSLNEHVIGMVTDPRLIIPAVTAIIMLTVGDVLYDTFEALRGPAAEKGFVHAAKLVMSGLSFLAIYGCGTAVLWYASSVLFRDSARGNHRVESWRSHGYDEMKSTFLLFAFSFALAGLPFIMLGTYLSAPIRMLLAPLLLLVAWFNQNAFVGVSFEPFVTFQTQSKSWKQFYIYVIALAALALVGGLLFYVPYGSIVGATLIAAATIAFAAAAGWQIGRAVKMMDES